MAGATGLEPATSGVTGRHSNQLSYTRIGSGLEDEGLGATAPPVKRISPELLAITKTQAPVE